jgi:cysteinyl-tRNA synthetase
LGETLDIHAGGVDLIFPHHECSLAQSECALAMPLAHIWLHTAMVTNQGKKMSKSEGNMVFINDLQPIGPDAARLCILACHYRKTWNFQDGHIRRAQDLADLFRQVGRWQSGSGAALDPSPYEHRFLAALSDDLDTPEALRTMEQLAREILRDASRRVAAAKGFLNRAFSILGIRPRFGA